MTIFKNICFKFGFIFYSGLKIPCADGCKFGTLAMHEHEYASTISMRINDC